MERLKNEGWDNYIIRRQMERRLIKAKLRGRWFYNNAKHAIKKGMFGTRNVPYVAKKTNRVSFTQELRDQRGYGQYLKNKTFGI
jgi:hypothetical protein